MKPVNFKGSNTIFAENQDEYQDLPAHFDGGCVTSCWQLSFYERLKLLFVGKVWLSILTHGSPLQPQLLSTHKPKASSDE